MSEHITIHAPAKVNLALHVTGQREDGYHLLDSLVAFTEVGDRVTVETSGHDAFTLSGRFAESLAGGGDNLVIRARDALRALMADPASTPPVRIHLEKNLPIASGIGGGSADAAATLRGLMSLWRIDLPSQVLDALALSLGADVPMCLRSRPLIARGIGEALEPVALPALPILLVNPMVPMSTPEIFRRLTIKANPPLPVGLLTELARPLQALIPLRNDLQGPAEALEPSIAQICRDLLRHDARIARMSGSGATCFGVFETQEACDRAAQGFTRGRPGWFVAATATRA